MQWLGIVEIVLIVLIALVLPLACFAIRGRWLARQGGTFECSLRLRTTTPSAGWVLGVARYSGENLEWFRFFSLSLRARVKLVRASINVVESREPDPVEAVSLYTGQRIVRVEVRGDSNGQIWDLAMSGDSLTGMLSWLEAAPPGVGGY